jgi:hypothetical protein
LHYYLPEYGNIETNNEIEDQRRKDNQKIVLEKAGEFRIHKTNR